MLIIDAMRRADTTQEVGFLLTSYVETLQFYDAAKRLPNGATTLPVNDLADIEARLAGLRSAQQRIRAGKQRRSDGPIIDEANNVFYEALCCWKALECCGAMPPLVHVAASASRMHASPR